ncbi:hypothetical protein AB07_0942 [Citrobacter freundii]|nr:hypothetical protein AB07_0942 [Citrobacter freundii]
MPHFFYLNRHNPLNRKTVFYYRPSYHELSSRLHEMRHDLKEAPDVSGG